MANNSRGPQHGSQSNQGNRDHRPAGKRFRTDDAAFAESARCDSSAHAVHYIPSSYGNSVSRKDPARSTGGHFSQKQSGPSQLPDRRSPDAQQGRLQSDAQGNRSRVAPVYTRQPRVQEKTSPIPVIIGVLIAVGIVVAAATFVFPALFNGPNASFEQVEPGQQVSLTIPEGASGDTIATILAENHVIDDSSTYYTAVKKLRAETSLKPGDYEFVTGQDAIEVVKQLVAGPNIIGLRFTVPEGKTIEQTAAIIEESLGISTSEFIEQAKASNYAEDYPFVADAYNDSLEGFLFPKTYEVSQQPTADEVIRVMLEQFKIEVLPAGYEEGANGLSAYEILSMAALIERETAVSEERPTVASVIYNRIDINMPLQIDAAIVYARGGGDGIVTYDDLEIDSPYNVYKNLGLTPGPICSPSLSSIQAALAPEETDYIYYVASASGDGSHRFTSNYSEFLGWSNEYNAAVS